MKLFFNRLTADWVIGDVNDVANCFSVIPSIHKILIKRCLTEKEMAHYIGMSVAFLRKDRAEGKIGNRTLGPKFLKIGLSIRYLRDELDRWLEENCRG